MRPTHKSGGRQPAVVPENASATATDFSEPSTFPPARSVFHPTAGLRQPLLVASADAVADVRFVSASPLPIPTAGLRQPLLVARRVFRAECDICDAQTHTHKSGGRQPAVVPETASATATDFSEPSTFAPARSVTVPRLAYASRSWLPARMLLLKCVSYPQVRYPFPRLAYASRSWLRDVCSVRNTTFAMHKRTPTRAAGVSPPWSVNRTQQRRKSPTIRPRCDATNKSGGRQPAVVPETASATATDFSEPSTFPPARSLSAPRLAYASRSWLRDVCSVRNATFAMHKRTLTRAAGVSPPWYRKPHLQRRPTFPNPARSPRHGRLPSHGWLTPAAPGCQRGCCC
jgi:hypothetical protein